MTALLDDQLPASLAAKVTDDQRQAIMDAPRGERLVALGAALPLPPRARFLLLADQKSPAKKHRRSLWSLS